MRFVAAPFYLSGILLILLGVGIEWLGGWLTDAARWMERK